MIDLYYFPSPNGIKVAIMPEQCGFAGKVVKVDIGRGDQFRPQFLRISPNNKIPALVGHDGAEGPVDLFESGAILVYLAEKARRLAGRDEQAGFAVQRDFALSNERLMDPDGYVFLYGQTASVVEDRRQSHESSGDGD